MVVERERACFVKNFVSRGRKNVTTSSEPATYCAAKLLHQKINGDKRTVGNGNPCSCLLLTAVLWMGHHDQQMKRSGNPNSMGPLKAPMALKFGEP